jgi:hypothetical protein
MTARSTNRPTRRRGCTVATALSALVVGATVAGTATGVADAAQPAQASHAAAASQSDRVLAVVQTSNNPQASKTTQYDYTDPHSGQRYFLMDAYAGSALSYVDWEHDTPSGAGRRSVDQVTIYASSKSWNEQTETHADLPKPSLGIQSSGVQVKQALQQSKAKFVGYVKIDGQQTKLLSITQASGNEREGLYVDRGTDTPVSETDVFTSRGHTYTTRSNWDRVSPAGLKQLEAKPSIPAGYTQEQPTS